MPPLAILFSAVLAGVALAMAVVSLLLRGAQERRGLSWPFFALSLALMLWSANQVVRNSCVDLVTGDVVARLASALSCVFVCATLLVYRRLLRVGGGVRFDRALSGVMIILGVVSLLSPGGLFFLRVEAIDIIPAGWWGPISVLRGQPDPLTPVLFFVFLAAVVRITWMTWSQRRISDRLLTTLLLIPPVAFLVPIVHGYGLIHGWWQGVPLGEYGMASEFIALVLALQRRERDLRQRIILHQRQIEAVLEHGLGFAGLLDPVGRLVLANRTALRAAGVVEGEVIGRHFTDTPWWRHSEEARRRLQAAIDRAAAGEPDRFVTNHLLPDGKLIDVDFSLTPYRGADGVIRYLIAEGRDISDLREMDRLVRESSKMHAIGQLAGGIAHDFNNVLCGIMGAAELALRRSEDPELRRRIETILTASSRAGDLTRRLLSFARKSKTQETPVRLSEVIGECLELFSRSAGPGIRIERDLWDGADVVLGNPAELQSAILNLCINARDAMPAGGILRLSTTRQVLSLPLPDVAGHHLSAGTYLRLAVSDHGSGIPADILPRIFEPFFTTKPEGKGTGLGLPAVLGTAHAHGGGLFVETQIGQGTTFALMLPLEAALTASATPAVQTQQARGELVVVIDDDDTVRHQAADLLRLLGFRVEVFGDPLLARRRLQQPTGVSCVLLDREMPGLNGRDLFRDLRTRAADLPVIISSGDTRGDQVVVDHPDRFLAYLPKPWRLEQMREVLLRIGVLSRSEAPAEVAQVG